MLMAQEGDNPAAMLQPVGAMAAAAHRLVIEPRVDETAGHGCQLCPANLCKVGFSGVSAPLLQLTFTIKVLLLAAYRVCKRMLRRLTGNVQGQELQALRQKPGFGRIVYCGDGANDLCPALMLGPDDYVRCPIPFAPFCVCSLLPTMLLERRCPEFACEQMCMRRSLHGTGTHWTGCWTSTQQKVRTASQHMCCCGETTASFVTQSRTSSAEYLLLDMGHSSSIPSGQRMIRQHQQKSLEFARV